MAAQISFYLFAHLVTWLLYRTSVHEKSIQSSLFKKVFLDAQPCALCYRHTVCFISVCLGWSISSFLASHVVHQQRIIRMDGGQIPRRISQIAEAISAMVVVVA